ncbi:MAG: GNAT family N-acetyltransferase [Rickettsiales bacterium]|nr:GNAT family N-acetyltransferase [Rickettsiales bacterium]
MTYTLKKLLTEDDWNAYNAIRKAELFPDRDYDLNHPDERLPDNHPLLLKFNDTPIATVRVDFRGDKVILRLLAVTKSEQGKKHGTNLYKHIEQYCISHGAKKLLVNAAPDAVGFYQKIGFTEEIWDQSELQGIAENCIQMARIIR